MKNQQLIGVAIVIVGLALTAYLSVKAKPDGTSGIYGTATIGPMCPVVKVGVPCPDKPDQVTINVYEVNPQTAIPMIYPLPPGTVQVTRKVTTFTTDAEGKFRVSLNPGSYVLRKDGKLTPPILPDTLATVEAGKFTEVNLSFDSGIR